LVRVGDAVDLVSQAEAVRGRGRQLGGGAARQRVPAPPNPPVSNRGVKSADKGTTKARQRGVRR
jgi:hypothetical protein